MKYKVTLSILMIILIVIGSLFCYRECNVVDNENEIETNNTNEEVNLEKQQEGLKRSDVNEEKITNILLLGIDKEENVSDTIMILSLNKEKKTIKLVSIMRDTFVYQGEGMANKMNYAYHYGGAQGAINTINNVFNLDIKNFVKVDFEGLIEIVDYLGGINIDINEEEREYVNKTCKSSHLASAGKVIINGQQTLAYVRTRKIDSDFERTERQRKVMHAIFINFKTLDVYKYPEFLYELKKISETNLSILEVLKYGDIVFSYDENSLSEFRIPMDGTWSDNTQGVYHLDWQEEVNKEALHNFIYN